MIDRLDTNVKSQSHSLHYVDTTALQWHFTVVLLFAILHLKYNEV